jgi:hypothetical protein
MAYPHDFFCGFALDPCTFATNRRLMTAGPTGLAFIGASTGVGALFYGTMSFLNGGADIEGEVWKGAQVGFTVGSTLVAVWQTTTSMMRFFRGGCFAEGTPILTSDGSKPIENVRPGDVVLSRPENNPSAPVEPRIVEEVFKRSSPVLELIVRGRLIRTTAEHPFHATGRGWLPAAQLSVGTLLTTLDGPPAEVEAVTPVDGEEAVYNFRVAEYHTYFVGSEQWRFGIWAHNSYMGNIVGPESPASSLPTVKVTPTVTKNFSQTTGKGANIRVSNQQEAESLLKDAFPEIYKNPTPTYSQQPPKTAWWQLHPSEPSVGNDLPHIKFQDWTGGKSKGVSGHIFFDGIPTSHS